MKDRFRDAEVVYDTPEKVKVGVKRMGAMFNTALELSQLESDGVSDETTALRFIALMAEFRDELEVGLTGMLISPEYRSTLIAIAVVASNNITEKFPGLKSKIIVSSNFTETKQ